MKATKLMAVALASALVVTPALAQSDAHEGHYPQQQGAAAPATSAPATAAGMGMMKMMGEGMDMSAMMQMMGRMQDAMSGCMHMGALDHVEGRIAFLRAELRITDAQNAAWTVFADAVRAAAQKPGSSPNVGTGPSALSDRIDAQERALTAKLDGVRALKAAFTPLFSKLSDEQKKTAEQLIGPYFGVPAMRMNGMSAMGMMQGGMNRGSGAPMPGMAK